MQIEASLQSKIPFRHREQQDVQLGVRERGGVRQDVQQVAQPAGAHAPLLPLRPGLPTEGTPREAREARLIWRSLYISD